MRRHRVRVFPDDTVLHAEHEEQLKSLLRRNGILLRGQCQDSGTCGLCRVVLEGSSATACTYHVTSDIVVYVPHTSRLASHMLMPRVVVACDADALYAAVDVGTTTLSAALLGEGGAFLANSCAFNPQMAYGEDVISRIVYAERAPEALSQLKACAARQIDALLVAMCEHIGKQRSQTLSQIVVSGNTVMSSVLLGRDPSPIRRESVAASMLGAFCGRGTDIGLEVFGELPVFVLPHAGAFVGGDVVAGVLAQHIADGDELSLLVDIGTNGEIVLGNREWLACCACSAGPAFEGAGVSCGMPAAPGAIHDAWLDSDSEVGFSVLGGGRPRGVCGSGLIALLDVMREAGIIDRSGRFAPAVPRVETSPDGTRRMLLAETDFDALYIEEPDLKNLMRAKAAIFGGIRTLLHSMGIDLAQISRVLLAGGFGMSLNIERAVRIGLVPDIDRNKIQTVGNTSLDGAAICAVDARARERVSRLARSMSYVDLSQDNRFTEEYVAAMFLPHTDLGLFPSVR